MTPIVCDSDNMTSRSFAEEHDDLLNDKFVTLTRTAINDLPLLEQ